MLEMIREYAREKLEASGDAREIRRRHAAYYHDLAQAAEHELSSGRQEPQLARLEAEYDNLCAALEWCAAEDVAAGLRLACSLRQFWHARGRLYEGRAWLEALLAPERGAAVPDALRARALAAAGFLAYQQGDLARAIELSEAGLGLHRAGGDRRGIADALLNLGSVAYYRNEYARAQALYAECLALYRELGARAEAALVLKNLGLVAKDQGDFIAAIAFYQESLALYQVAGDKRGMAQAFFNLGVVAYWQGDYAGAIELSEQGLARYRDLGDQMGAAYALDTLGMAFHKHGDHGQARRVLEQSLEILRALGDQVGIALLLTDLGLVAQAQGDQARAGRLHREGLALAWKIGDKRRAAFCLEGLAVAVGQQPRYAARLFGAAEALREAIGSPLPHAERATYERDVATLRAADPGAFDAAWAEGRAIPSEHVLAGALRGLRAED
jgi:tetratricopeptide (TPR) repeat protein